MSDLAKRPETAPATTDGPDGDRPKNPLRQLPREWRAPVGFFFACYSDVLKGTTGLVARLRLWIKEDGLTLSEATAILKHLLAPEQCARFQFAGQLLAELARLVAEAGRRRRRDERIARERAQAAEFAGRPQSERVRRAIDGIGRPD